MENLIRKIINLFEIKSKYRIIKKLKKIFSTNIDIFFDVGGHHGETTIFLNKSFIINKNYIFEPSQESFKKLEKNTANLRKKSNLYIFNFALGNETKNILLKQVRESSSSTFHDFDESTAYFKRKNKILNFFNKKNFFVTKTVKIKNIQDFIKENNIKKIDLMKIDTEGYEYYILEGLKEFIKNIKVIYFEHHYDLMIKKGYKFNDIHNLLLKFGFNKYFKEKMIFRKSFEYIYINSKN